MRRPLALVALAVLLVAGCGDDSSSTDDESFDPPTTAVGGDLPEDTVVFSPDDVETDLYGDEVTWTPTADDIETVEDRLADHIDADPDLGVDDLGGYHRQYVGTGDDEDVVSVNALCTVDGFDWEDDLILVNDGGSCFWTAQVNTTLFTVDSFSVNGNA